MITFVACRYKKYTVHGNLDFNSCTAERTRN